MKRFIKYITVVCLIFTLSGCGSNGKDLGDDGKSKFYFTANIYPGDTYKTNHGTGVYERGRVNKLYKDQWRTRVTADGGKLIALLPYKGENVDLVDLKTGEIKKLQFKTYPIIFRWFEDKTKVIYAGTDEGASNLNRSVNLYLLNLKTMEHKKITNYKEDDNVTMYYIDLSPDEKKVVYSVARRKVDKHSTVKIVDIETGEEKTLPFSAYSFAWNPASNKILLFGIDKDVQGEIEYGARLIIYDPETNQIVKKYLKDETYSHMEWMTNSPDGKKIAYVRNENNGSLTVWTMDPDGTNQKLVWKPKVFLRDLNWTK